MLTNEQKKEIVKLYKNGEKQNNIASQFNCSRSLIGKIVRQANACKYSNDDKIRIPPKILNKVKQLYKSGLQIDKIASKLKKSKNSIYRIIKHLGLSRKQPISDEDIQEIIRLYPKYTLKQLAKKFKRDSKTIRNILVSNSIEIRKPILINTSLDKISNRYDHDKIIKLYKSGESITKIAKSVGCAHETVRLILIKNNIKIRSNSEQFSGGGNPFYGKKHPDNVVKKCKEIGSKAGKEFWNEHPEYREIVKEKQKELWENPERRKEWSARSAKLLSENNFNAKGEIETRFGIIKYDSSYEMDFIKLCDGIDEIISLERDFDIVGYEFEKVAHNYIPDFRVKLKDKRETIVEIKGDNLLLDKKTIAKQQAGREKYENYMMINNDFAPFLDWAFNYEIPFEFKDITIIKTKSEIAREFYNTYHYLGYTGGHTFVGLLNGQIIAAATFGGITRLEIAKRLEIESSEILELRRFCIHSDYHKQNLATWFMSRIIKKIKELYEYEGKKLRALISFSDTSQNHEGTIYKASNWKYDGMTKKNYHYEDKHGKIIHKRGVWDKAKAEGITETEYAGGNGLTKIWRKPKKRWLWAYK